MAPPIRVMPPEVMALDIETDCATDAAGARGRADGGCNERRPVEPSIVDLHRGDGRCRRGTLNLDLPWQRITVAAGVTYPVLGNLDMMRKPVLPRREVNGCFAPPAQIGVTQCALQIASVIEAVLIALSPEREHTPC